MKKLLVLTLALSFFLNIALFPVAGFALPQANGFGTEGAARTVTDRERIQPRNGKIFMEGNLGQVKDSSGVKEFLEGQKEQLKAGGQATSFEVETVKKDELNMTHYKAQQFYKGVPVYGHEVILHADVGDNVVSVNGSVDDVMSIDVSPTITSDKALEIARETVNAPKGNQPNKKLPFGKSAPVDKCSLVIYEYGKQTYLAYVTEFGFQKPKPSAWKVFVDAKTGEVINKVNRLIDFTRTTGYGFGYYGDRKNLNIILDNDYVYRLIEKTTADSYTDRNVILTLDYDILMYSDNDPFYPDTNGVFDSFYQRIGVDAHYNMDTVFNYFKGKFIRNSWDGQGAAIDVFTNGTDVLDNAWWDSLNQVFYFGRGDDDNYAPLSTALDVVAHEYTHAIVDDETKLEYENQSGALHESLADTFACLIDPDWQIGEDVVTPGTPGDAMRDLSNPPLFNQPEHMNDYIYTVEDNGGVHDNSGIPNKAFYNIASAIGRDAAGKIYYRAITNYLTMYSDFADAKLALKLSAKDLYGANSSQYQAVALGWGAVGVVDPYGLSLNKNIVNLTVGTPETLQATLGYDDGTSTVVNSDATWTTSRPTVVTVDHGVLTPVAKGTATITAQYGAFKVTANVTVTPALTDLQVDKTAVGLISGASSGVKATAFYNDGSKALVSRTAQWSSSDEAVAIVNLGTIKGVARGEAVITVEYLGEQIDISVKVTPPVTSVLANKSNLDITVADTVDLTATANYNDNTFESVTDTAVWKSSNTRVATVTGGRVVAVGKGKTTVTAEFNRKKATIKINVTPPVTSVTLDKTSLVFLPGRGTKLRATAYFNDGSKAALTSSPVISWASSDTDVVTVTGGLVTPVGPGEADVTVEYKGQTAVCSVKVAPSAVTELTVDQIALAITAGDEPVQIEATANYDGYPGEIVTDYATWRSSNSRVVTVRGGIITPVGPGTASVSVQYLGKSAVVKVTVTM